jgi:hypothetical protein
MIWTSNFERERGQHETNVTKHKTRKRDHGNSGRNEWSTDPQPQTWVRANYSLWQV